MTSQEEIGMGLQQLRMMNPSHSAAQLADILEEKRPELFRPAYQREPYVLTAESNGARCAFQSYSPSGPRLCDLPRGHSSAHHYA